MPTTQEAVSAFTDSFYTRLCEGSLDGVPRSDRVPTDCAAWQRVMPYVRDECAGALPYHYVRDTEAFYVVLWCWDNPEFVLEWAKRLQHLLRDSKYHMYILESREPVDPRGELDTRQHNVHVHGGDAATPIGVWLRTMMSCNLLVVDDHPFAWVAAAWNVYGLSVGRNLPLVLRGEHERVIDTEIVRANRGGDTYENRCNEHVLRYLLLHGQLATTVDVQQG